MPFAADNLVSKMRQKWLVLLLFFVSSGLAYPIGSRGAEAAINDDSSLWYNHFSVLACAFLVVGILLVAGCLECCRQRAAGFKEFRNPRTEHDETINGNVSLGFLNPFQSNSAIFQSPTHSFGGGDSAEPESIVVFEPLPHVVPKRFSHPRLPLWNKTSVSSLSVQHWFGGQNVDFSRDQLHYLREIGQGWFGKVVEGEAKGLLPPSNKVCRVVVRILKEDASSMDQALFLHEAKPYHDLSHPNVLKVLGRCLENVPYLLIFEHCLNGDLKRYLQQNVANRETFISQGAVLRMAIDVATGLNHMLQNGFVHSDVATRNCLVTSDLRVKIGDYGASIQIYKDEYYRTGDVALPIRWCAPETVKFTERSIETKQVTGASCVWSYGVLLWELEEWGQLPYKDLTDDQVISRVFGNDAVRLPVPSYKTPYTDYLYSIMEDCWQSEADRPSFIHIINLITTLLHKFKNTEFESRWLSCKPNIIPVVDNEMKSSVIHGTKHDSDSGIDSESAQFRHIIHNSPVKKKQVSDDINSSPSSSRRYSGSSATDLFSSSTTLSLKQKSPSLENLQGSLDNLNSAKHIPFITEGTTSSDFSVWFKGPENLGSVGLAEEYSAQSSQNSTLDFRLGPVNGGVNRRDSWGHQPLFPQDSLHDDSLAVKKGPLDSLTDTEDEVWRRRIERGEFTEKVKEKSKSVADLMILTHIDYSESSDTDSMPSLSRQSSFNKYNRRVPKLPNAAGSLMSSLNFGSESNLPVVEKDDEFQETLKKIQVAKINKDEDSLTLFSSLITCPKLNDHNQNGGSKIGFKPTTEKCTKPVSSDCAENEIDHFLGYSSLRAEQPIATVRNEHVSDALDKLEVPSVVLGPSENYMLEYFKGLKTTLEDRKPVGESKKAVSEEASSSFQEFLTDTLDDYLYSINHSNKTVSETSTCVSCKCDLNHAELKACSNCGSVYHGSNICGFPSDDSGRGTDYVNSGDGSSDRSLDGCISEQMDDLRNRLEDVAASFVPSSEGSCSSLEEEYCSAYRSISENEGRIWCCVTEEDIADQRSVQSWTETDESVQTIIGSVSQNSLLSREKLPTVDETRGETNVSRVVRGKDGSPKEENAENNKPKFKLGYLPQIPKFGEKVNYSPSTETVRRKGDIDVDALLESWKEDFENLFYGKPLKSSCIDPESSTKSADMPDETPGINSTPKLTPQIEHVPSESAEICQKTNEPGKQRITEKPKNVEGAKSKKINAELVADFKKQCAKFDRLTGNLPPVEICASNRPRKINIDAMLESWKGEFENLFYGRVLSEDVQNKENTSQSVTPTESSGPESGHIKDLHKLKLENKTSSSKCGVKKNTAVNNCRRKSVPSDSDRCAEIEKLLETWTKDFEDFFYEQFSKSGVSEGGQNEWDKIYEISESQGGPNNAKNGEVNSKKYSYDKKKFDELLKKWGQSFEELVHGYRLRNGGSKNYRSRKFTPREQTEIVQNIISSLEYSVAHVAEKDKRMSENAHSNGFFLHDPKTKTVDEQGHRELTEEESNDETNTFQLNADVLEALRKELKEKLPLQSQSVDENVHKSEATSSGDTVITNNAIYPKTLSPIAEEEEDYATSSGSSIYEYASSTDSISSCRSEFETNLREMIRESVDYTAAGVVSMLEPKDRSPAAGGNTDLDDVCSPEISSCWDKKPNDLTYSVETGGTSEYEELDNADLDSLKSENGDCVSETSSKTSAQLSYSSSSESGNLSDVFLSPSSPTSKAFEDIPSDSNEQQCKIKEEKNGSICPNMYMCNATTSACMSPDSLNSPSTPCNKESPISPCLVNHMKASENIDALISGADCSESFQLQYSEEYKECGDTSKRREVQEAWLKSFFLPYSGTASLVNLGAQLSDVETHSLPLSINFESGNWHPTEELINVESFPTRISPPVTPTTVDNDVQLSENSNQKSDNTSDRVIGSQNSNLEGKLLSHVSDSTDNIRKSDTHNRAEFELLETENSGLARSEYVTEFGLALSESGKKDSNNCDAKSSGCPCAEQGSCCEDHVNECGTNRNKDSNPGGVVSPNEGCVREQIVEGKEFDKYTTVTDEGDCHLEESVSLNASSDDDEDEDGTTEEFTPSSWNSSAMPNKSLLKSPEHEERKSQKKNVSFKKQKYHCVYEYPKEEAHYASNCFNVSFDSHAQQSSNPFSMYQSYADICNEYPALGDWELEGECCEQMADDDILWDDSIDNSSTIQSVKKPNFYSFSGTDYDAYSGITSSDEYVSPSVGSSISQCNPLEVKHHTFTFVADNSNQSDENALTVEGSDRDIDIVDAVISPKVPTMSDLGELKHTKDKLKLHLNDTNSPSSSVPSISANTDPSFG